MLDCFQGQFFEGLMHGEGTYTWSDGVVYSVRAISPFLEPLSTLKSLNSSCRQVVLSTRQ